MKHLLFTLIFALTTATIHARPKELLELLDSLDREVELREEYLHHPATANSQTDSNIIRKLSHARLLRHAGDTIMALGELIDLYDNVSPEDPLHASIAYHLASLYSSRDDKYNEYLYFLTLSAISDVRQANIISPALADLAFELASIHDIDRAYNYNIAANPKNNITTLSKTVYDRQQRTIWIIGSVCLLLVGCIVWLVLILKRRQRLIRTGEQDLQNLRNSLTAREEYINQLLGLCSVYVEGLEDYNRLVSRKLKAGQGQDLYKIAESGKILQEHTDRFFEVFDTAILNIFPQFVNDVNRLMQADKQISCPEQRLTPELRILAFMRLGISDSAQISKFLSLSLNTVYTYRTRIKSRAINRITFEEDLRKF